MKVQDRIAALRESIYAAAAVNGVREVRVFGSVARGDESDDSDIDFLVSLEPGRTLLDLARFEVQLEQLLGRQVDVVTEDGLREPIRTDALREATHV
jgi:predicted nucleotidyltransferase